MPAVTDDEDDQINIPIDPGSPIIAKPELKDVVIDVAYQPVAGLMTNVEGTPWTLKNYYSQVLGKDSAVSGQQFNRDSVYQQYKCIRDLELRVTTPLATTQDDQSNSMRLTGAATLYPFIIPNVGDMFIASIGDGHDGIFQITRVERKSIFREACYTVEYNLIERATVELSKDLESKTIQVYHFIRDYLVNNQNPLVTEDEFGIVRRLNAEYGGLCDRFFDYFTSTKYATLLVPEQTDVTYDPGVVKFITTTLTLQDYPYLRELREFNVEGPSETTALTFWDMLIKRDARGLKGLVHHEYGTISYFHFPTNVYMGNVRFTGIEQVVVPKIKGYRVDHDDSDNLLPFEKVTVSDAALVDKVIPELSLDYYLFPAAFYQQQTYPMSVLEVELTNFFKLKRMSSANLSKLVDSVGTWSPIETFYYLPILMFLIKSHIRSF